MTSLRTIGWMARKELLRFLADPMGAVLTLCVPILLAVLMSSVFAPRDLLDPLPLLVVEEGGGGPRVERLLERLTANPAVVIERTTLEDARERVFSGEAAAAIVLSPDVDGVLQPLSLFAGDAVPVDILLDPSRGTEVDILEGVLTREVMEQLSEELGSTEGRTALFQQIGLLTATSPGVLPDDRERWSDFANAGVALKDNATTTDESSFGSPITLNRQTLDVFNPKAEWNAYAHYFAGMLTMSLLFLGATAALNLLQEREEGALARVRLSGANPILALLGAALGTTIVSVVTAFCVFASGVIVFGIPVSSPLGLVAMLLASGAMVGGFSLFLAAIGNTARQISIVGPFAILVMGFLGGSAVPSFIMPEYVRSMAIFLPTTWANEGLAAATWRGAPTMDCLEWAAGVLAYGAVFGLLGAVLFRWRR